MVIALLVLIAAILLFGREYVAGCLGIIISGGLLIVFALILLFVLFALASG